MEAMNDDKKEEGLKYPAKWITGKEMVGILKLCGASIRNFAEYCERSENFIRQSLGYEWDVSIPLLYIDKLSEFVGIENMQIALISVRNELESEDRSYKETMQKILSGGAPYRS